MDSYESFINSNYQDLLQNYWQSYNCIQGNTITVHQSQESISGSVQGISNDGALLLKLDNQQIREIRVGDVSLRPD